MSDLVGVEIADQVCELTMLNSAKLNAISADLAHGLIAGLAAAEHHNARVVILRAETGVKTWSAGHDITELPDNGVDPLTWQNALEKLLRKVRGTPMPVIAAVEGGVWGGACDLVMSCDLVVASRDTTFAITPVKLGLPYNTAGVQHFLAAMPVHVVKEMFFTADPISASRAFDVGIVNRLVDEGGDVVEQARVFATRIAERAPLAVRAIKAEIKALSDAQPLTSDVFEHVTSQRRLAWASNDYSEGLKAFKERRTPNFEGK